MPVDMPSIAGTPPHPPSRSRRAPPRKRRPSCAVSLAVLSGATLRQSRRRASPHATHHAHRPSPNLNLWTTKAVTDPPPAKDATRRALSMSGIDRGFPSFSGLVGNIDARSMSHRFLPSPFSFGSPLYSIAETMPPRLVSSIPPLHYAYPPVLPRVHDTEMPCISAPQPALNVGRSNPGINCQSCSSGNKGTKCDEYAECGSLCKCRRRPATNST